MWSYDQSTQPPAPFLDVLICHPRTPDQCQHVRAKLDTGADLSAIPQVVADELELLAARTILADKKVASGQTGRQPQQSRETLRQAQDVT